MKFIFVIKEYIAMAWKCLRYIYQFDKRGTLTRLAIFLSFPITANMLAIANARLTDSMQQNFGTGLMSAIIPVFLVVVGVEIIEEFVNYLRRITNAIWRSRTRTIIEIERNRKKTEFTVPFIDSRDYSRFIERIRNTGGDNAQLDLLLSIPDSIRIIINFAFAFYIVSQFSIIYALIIIVAAIPSFFTSFSQIFERQKLDEEQLDYNRYTHIYNRTFINWTEFKDGKIAGALKYILNIYKNRRETVLLQWEKLHKKHGKSSLVTNLISMLAGFAIQYFVIKDTIGGSLLIGQATLIVMQVNRLQNTIGEFAFFLPDQYESVIACKYIFLYLNSKENTEKKSGIIPEIKNDMLEFKNISFSYPIVHMKSMEELKEQIEAESEKYFGLPRMPEEEKSEDSHKNFKLKIPNLTISKGERIAIVGQNGNGKTTFLQVLMNIYPITEGDIFLFGNNIKEMKDSDVHSNFSMLFQDFSNNDLKTHEYIGLSEIENPDLNRVKAAAKLAGADEFIEKWKDQYIQQLGISFRGVKPSKGQWQKLALARTLYKDSPIIILDEPTAAIDAIASKQIFKNLANFDPNKILIFVCHNISDIPLAATRVLVFDQGKIVGDGPHHELLKTCAIYKELYDSEKGV